MKHWITAVGTLAMMSGGCGSIVLDPVQSDEAAGAVGAGGRGEFEAGFTALAMRAGDWAPQSDPAGMWTVSAPYPLDPDTLMLFMSSEAQSCSEPVIQPDVDASPCDPGNAFWQSLLFIPPELDRPGLIDLTDRRIFTYQAVWLADCGGGNMNGPGLQGTLEIVSSDATAISVKLRVGDREGWASIDGDYTARFCGEAPPASPPSPALAIRGADLPAPPDGGPPADPDALQLSFGTAVDTCDDPSSPIDCTSTSRVVLTLPPSLQAPGLVNLADLGASYSLSLDTPAYCTASDRVTGLLLQGTIEILSIDTNAILFRVYGSNTSPSGGFDADGLYAASICP